MGQVFDEKLAKAKEKFYSLIEKNIYIDFEFNQVSEPKLNLVSCAALIDSKHKYNWWLHNYDSDIASKKSRDLNLLLSKKDRVIISFAAVAEARSFIALGLNPLDFQWIDLRTEWQCLTNHNDRLQYGKHLVDGKVKNSFKPKPKWEREEGEDSESHKLVHSLAECTYKLTGMIRDTKEKDEVRDLIISNPEKFSLEERHRILSYGQDDVAFLPNILDRMIEEYCLLDSYYLNNIEILFEEMTRRGRYNAHTAIMENTGYPIDVDKTKRFSRQVDSILLELQIDINSQFPEIKPFKWNKKENRYSWNKIVTKDWIRKTHAEHLGRWMKTDTKDLALSLEAWQRFYDFKHNYPRGNFGAQIVRYLKMRQAIYGFAKKEGEKNFWDFVGSDGRVRPYMGTFASQSSRSQPSSKGFMFLKPAWMRSLVQPKPGMALGGIDYGSQEYFIQAIKSACHRMVSAYLSGDVYLAFAKDANIVPKDATKESHKVDRDNCKQTVLGISYLMTKYGLAVELTNNSGRKWTEDEAQEMIDVFYSAYPELKEYQDYTVDLYRDERKIILPCGWTMWGDNTNFRSVTNVPIQGFGASVMRKAVDLAVSRGLSVIFTLHDALYIEFKVGEEYKMEILRDCMREAFQFYFKDGWEKETAAKIKLDPFIWSPDYEKDSSIKLDSGYIIPCSNLYLDERAEADYKMFSRYFEDTATDIL